MVEFCVFLMQEYYEDYNKEKKDVFGAVHFALFYTAILNAFQSIILAFAVGRVSQQVWVRTEALELNHYVEIREEFDRVTRELGRLQHGRQSLAGGTSIWGSNEDKQQPNTAERWSIASEESGWRGLFHAVMDRIKYPGLKARYNELLIQVRFHELRVHFLKAYNLPLKLKISDYLLRSEQHVLIKLIHVTSTAWLLLTASINLLYFILGIVGTKTGNPGLVGTTLIYIFFCGLCIFIVLALLLYRKVRKIFAEIMHRRELWEVQEDTDEKEKLAAQQMGLFWGSSPKLIIAAIQFMQFGYAVSLATVIMFWEEIADGGVSMLWYWVAILVCYSLFVAVAAKVIPQYTLCTSLGQLVDKKRLSESVAIFHLEEAKRQRREEIVLRAAMDDTLRIAPETMGTILSTRGESDISSRPGSTEGAFLQFPAGATSLPSERTEGGLSIADLVSLNTDSLRTTLTDSERDALATRLAHRRDRRKRMKSVSDGVAFMASLGTVKPQSEQTAATRAPAMRTVDDLSLQSDDKKDADSVPQEPLHVWDTSRQSLLERRRSRRGRIKTVSDGVAQMAAMTGEIPPAAAPPKLSMVKENSERIAEFVFADTKTLRDSVRSHSARTKSNSDGVKAMAKDHDPARLSPEERRSRRTKAVSDGVKAMAALSLPFFSKKEDTSEEMKVSPKPKKEHRELTEEELENASMRSLASDDDHSDFDDVPEADPNMMKMMTVEVVEKRVTLRERAKNYFLSKQYPITSNVFGTMIAFFVVGSRIERFLHTENIVSQEWISFDFGETITFSTLTAFLSLFLLTDFGILSTLGPYHMQHELRARKVWVAAILDFCLCAVCLSMFFWAEHERCCTPSEEEDERFLAEYDAATDKSEEDLLPAPCACPPFGSRLYGGLGTIEPYTSLIALRLFRFWAASRVVKFLDKKRGTAITKEEAKQIAADNENLDPFDVTDDAHGHGHGAHGSAGHGDDHGGHGHHGEEKGTIAELWEAAVGKHPEIVAKYGEFSGELLQVMLGIPIIEQDLVPSPEVVIEGTPRPDSHRETYLIDKQFAKLPCEAQEIIMAGKLGKAVVSEPETGSHEHTFTIPEHDHGEHVVRPKGLRFSVVDASIPQELDPSTSAFDAPNAQLVRSMRRCERKLLPILDHWTVVDVVMTRFEIVYFDAVGVDDSCPNTAVFDALGATKGGKGLRLCDVAAGRRVVGHLSLSDVTSIHVEREMPTDDCHEDTNIPDNEIVRKVEFWKNKTDTVGFNRREFWHKIKQDRLVAETAHGNILYLRFFSDLEDAQNHPEHYSADNEVEGDLYKNNAFQWVQSIIRMCGPEQLKQALPHYGDDTNDELRDFLVVHRNEEEPRGHRRGLSRGFGSSVRLDALGSRSDDEEPRGHRRGLSRGFMSSVRLDTLAHAAPNKPGPARRSSSFGESLSSSLHRKSSSQRSRTATEGADAFAATSSSRGLFRRFSSHGKDEEEPSAPQGAPSGSEMGGIKNNSDDHEDGDAIV